LHKTRQRHAALRVPMAAQDAPAAAAQAKLVTIRETLASMDEDRRQDQSALLEVERTIQNARERLARLEAEKLALERWLSKDPIAAASGALRQASLPGIHGPVRSLFKTSGSYERL